MLASPRALNLESQPLNADPQEISEFLTNETSVRKFLPKLLKLLPFRETLKQILSLSFPAQKKYLTQLLDFNSQQGFARIQFKFADLLEAQGRNHQKILLLGDRNLISIELAKRNFSKISVADSNRSLLEKINRKTQHLHCPPRIFEVDFQRTINLDKANIAILTPTNTAGKIRTLLKAALDNFDPNTSKTLYLIFNPYVVGQTETAKIIAFLREQNFIMKTYYPKFKAQPVSWLQKKILRMCWLLLLKNRSKIATRSDLYSFADCFEFNAQAHRKL